MATPPHFQNEGEECGHALTPGDLLLRVVGVQDAGELFGCSPSLLGKWMSVVMVTPTSFPE